jgi:hypothetical protein
MAVRVEVVDGRGWENESFSVEGGEEFLAVRRLVGQLAKSDLVRVSLRDQS